MSEQNKKIIADLHRKDLTNIKFASALLDMAIEEKKDDLNFALQQAKEVQKIAAKESRKKNSTKITQDIDSERYRHLMRMESLTLFMIMAKVSLQNIS